MILFYSIYSPSLECLLSMGSSTTTTRSTTPSDTTYSCWCYSCSYWYRTIGRPSSTVGGVLQATRLLLWPNRTTRTTTTSSYWYPSSRTKGMLVWYKIVTNGDQSGDWRMSLACVVIIYIFLFFAILVIKFWWIIDSNNVIKIVWCIISSSLLCCYYYI